ncbi:MAG: phosphoglucosamine mutase [Verrucomicrobiales bacterium]|nr:phosphoglucosamine mutase [Verrucomicrobiales bacterium]
MSARRKWFGTDGIRACYGVEPMTPEFVWRIGRAAAKYWGQSRQAPLFIVGRDTRASGTVLEDCLCRGLLAGGAQVTRLGVVPSGAVSLLTPAIGAAAGVMISASHNEYRDNGIKFFDHAGFKLTDQDELAVERHLGRGRRVPPLSHEIPTVMDFGAQPIYLEMYRQALAKTVPADFSLDGRTLVVDAANGAAWGIAAGILSGYGARVEKIGCLPDGRNINDGCGSTHPEPLTVKVRQHPGAIGLAFDGDADRLLMVDEDGAPLDGDEIMALVGVHLLRHGALPGKTLVTTVMSNLGLDEAIAAAGGAVVRTEVGDRYVLEKMRAGGFTVGGEQSGHFLFLDYAASGDGLLSALQVLNICRAERRSLRELRKVMRKYPQQLFSRPVARKTPLAKLPGLRAAIADAEARLGGRGRVVARYSGTEHKIRVLLEAADAVLLKKIAPPLLKIVAKLR